MKIHEHTAGSKVRLLYIGKEQNDMFTTEIVNVANEPDSYHIVCKPIIINEQYVMFPTQGLIAEITNPETGRVYRYRINLCGHIRYKGKTYFAMCSYDDVKEFNRRSQFRVGFTAYGVIQPRANTKVWECSTHDISFNGIGIHVRKESGFVGVVGDYASISFTHPRNGKLYKVSGTIVRIDESTINDNFYIIGVRIDNCNFNAWTGLVATEQRLIIRKQKGLI